MTTSGATTTADAMVAIEGLRHCLETGDWERLPEVYAPDALLDANVPQWRFQLRGLDEIVAQHREWYQVPARIVEWTATPTGFGAVVEQAEWIVAGDDEMYSRSIHLIHVDKSGRIARHVLSCTGYWDRATVERQAREAPMYER